MAMLNNQRVNLFVYGNRGMTRTLTTGIMDDN
jgi:hypothetical protein